MTKTNIDLYNVVLIQKLNSWKAESLINQHVVTRKSDLSYNYERILVEIPELEENY